MSAYVIDASAAVEYLLRTPLGQTLNGQIENAVLIAPELLDVEVLSVLRRTVLQRKISAVRAEEALLDLSTWQIDRVSHLKLTPIAWTCRYNVSAYDAFYVATAKLYELPLLTIDGPLTRAPELGIVIHNISLH